MHDFGANDYLFIMLRKRFGDPPGRRLHVNFPRIGKCRDRSDITENSIHGELKISFMQASGNIAAAMRPPAGKTT